MPKITDIKDSKKTTERVHIYIDGEYFKTTLKEISFGLNLYIGKDVEKSILNEMILKEDFIKCKNKALQIISAAPQSEKNLNIKLKKYDFNEDIINKVIKNLKEYNLVNDENLANSIIKDKRNLSHFGKRKIYYDLIKKGIDERVAQEEISKLEDNDLELENAIFLSKKKIKTIKDKDRNKVYQKLARHLTYKGFSYDIVKKAIEKTLK